PPAALSITATSFVDYKNTYTPAKAFDGDLKTGWLEGVKGPGTGEAITLKLNKEITVDEIAVAPGYFDPKWWKSNNRVKSLRVTYGETSQVLNFKDEMTAQNTKLAKEIRFSGITFEIAEVYLSGKDNDTALSEIEFYYKGEKVVIDMSGVK
ncbi:MAG: discoidin domain-containing protein, partial [Candidatus Pacearchaeota archaeon]|nr:discoidin domain-containing protein [Candidatus Pacearchaeota archaeon]